MSTVTATIYEQQKKILKKKNSKLALHVRSTSVYVLRPFSAKMTTDGHGNHGCEYLIKWTSHLHIPLGTVQKRNYKLVIKYNLKDQESTTDQN